MRRISRIRPARRLALALSGIALALVGGTSGTQDAVANGDTRSLDVKVGDKVLFGKYAGTEIKVDGKELLVMREEDVMGVVEA